MASSAWPRPKEAPATDDLSKCVHCGLCVNACPTYVITGLEVESPRGRIHLARSIDEGRIPLTATVQSHWELCLQCRACEAVCPSGVPYGRIMEHARAQLDAKAPAHGGSRMLRKSLLRNVIGRQPALHFVMSPVRWYANSSVRGFSRRAGLLRLLGALGRAESQLPDRVGPPFGRDEVLAQPEEARATAMLLTGCVMSELFGDVHRATGRVFARSGIALQAPEDQVCCGALHAHDGDVNFARTLARKNIDAFGQGEEPIVVNSAGCGAAMKEYGDLLRGDARYRDRARAFAARVRDATEYLATIGPLPRGALPAKVAYQDACHLAHAQRIRNQPRDLLSALEGCTLIETEGADMCCGAAGIYSLVQPEMSAQLRSRKASQFAQHQPHIVVTANPGCQMQYNAAVREAGTNARVLHVMEALDEAQRAAGD